MGPQEEQLEMKLGRGLALVKSPVWCAKMSRLSGMLVEVSYEEK